MNQVLVLVCCLSLQNKYIDIKKIANKHVGVILKRRQKRPKNSCFFFFIFFVTPFYIQAFSQELL